MTFQPSNQDSREAREAYNRGELHHSNRRFHDALREFKRAHTLDPDNDRYMFKLAAAYHNTEQYELSAQMYAELIERLENKPFREALLLALAYRGGNLAMLGEYDEAARLIERALEMDSVSVIGLAMKAQLYLSQGYLREALDYIQRAHEIDPGNKIVCAIRNRILNHLEPR